MIKKYWAYILLGFSILFFIYKQIEKPNKNFELKTIKTNTGWGYEIYNHKKLYIHQEFIPAIQGNKSFATERDATTVGKFIIGKMEKLKTDLPHITVEELDSLKIIK